MLEEEVLQGGGVPMDAILYTQERHLLESLHMLAACSWCEHVQCILHLVGVRRRAGSVTIRIRRCLDQDRSLRSIWDSVVLHCSTARAVSWMRVLVAMQCPRERHGACFAAGGLGQGLRSVPCGPLGGIGLVLRGLPCCAVLWSSMPVGRLARASPCMPPAASDAGAGVSA